MLVALATQLIELGHSNPYRVCYKLAVTFPHSVKAKIPWKQQTGQTMASYSATRWWSKWQLMKQMMVQFGEIEPFLNHNTDLGPSS